MVQDEDEKLLDIFLRSNLPSILGAVSFVSDIKDRFFKKKIDLQIPASKRLAPGVHNVAAAVCKYYKIDPEQLKLIDTASKMNLAMLRFILHVSCAPSR